ncbi:MAG: hypothetical protein MAG581_02028 [Deltaproteobacteria bacterium]|jgi:hypothetical protein|nr:hypothetical protein [Deltaproteobacteria bacterium]
MLEDKSDTRPATKSFHENLIQRLGPYEVQALDVLGQDFFYLVDQLSANLHENHLQDAPLLDLSESEFPWELQVFANQFLRECAQSTGRLTNFCEGLRKRLDEPEFRKDFWRLLDEAYKHHFYVTDSEKHLLV